MRRLLGKNVVVTGAAAGIGLECAKAFARRGARLLISDVNEGALDQARQAVAALGADCQAWPCDVSDAVSVARFASAVHEQAGPVDVLVNNAGIAFLGSFEETPVTQWRRMLDVNVLGIVHCTQAFLPAMRAAGGERKIVNVASLAGVAPAPNMSAYAASKHAVIGLSEVLALELHDSPVSVTVICPGIINTDIVRTPNTTAPGITEEQIGKLRRYYVEHGCLPDVVGEAIARGVERDDHYVFCGPMAKPASVLARVSRRLTRKVTLRDSRRSGYLV